MPKTIGQSHDVYAVNINSNCYCFFAVWSRKLALIPHHTTQINCRIYSQPYYSLLFAIGLCNDVQ